jgi:hypothetical protein
MATLLTILLIIALLGPVLMVPVLLVVYTIIDRDISYFPPKQDTLQLLEHTETSWNNTLSHQPEHMNKKLTCKGGCCEYTVR